MKKFLTVVFFCFPTFGQTAYSGLGLSSGSAAYGSFTSGGAPLTYSARTDNCVTGTESGCISGKTTGEAGSALIFQEGTSDPVPFNRLDTDTNSGFCPSYTPPFHADCAVAGVPFIDPDFGSYSIFVTDQNTRAANPKNGYATGSGGSVDLFGIGYPNDVLFNFTDGGSVTYLAHILEANLLAHACATSACVVKSNVTGANCTPTPGVYTGAGICTQTQASNGSITMSRNPLDSPNTFYEANLPIIVKTTLATGNTTLTGGPGNDTVTRVAHVNFATDSGGAIPCSILPSDYQSLWSGAFTVSDGGAINLASAGGGSYQTIWQQMGLGSNPGVTTVTNDVFIMPANNVAGPPTITNWMFQASAGTTSGSEPNWSANCSTQGSTCTDGSVTWTNIGKVASQGPGFDVLHFDPQRGCSRINSRLMKIYRGTNEGTNWPNAGAADLSGQIITDDAMVCFRMGGSNCGTGGTVNLTDKFTLHEANQGFNSQYGGMGVTGGGSPDKNYTGGGGGWPEISPNPTGSCVATTTYTTFANWPNSVWVSGANYGSGKYVVSPLNHAFYKSLFALTADTLDPSSDPTNWRYSSTYCYNYIIDWYTNIVRPIQELGPHYGGSGHFAPGYNFDYRGGVYWQHYYNHPNCQNDTGPCAAVGEPNPGVPLLSNALPNDGHPSSRNLVAGDLQPIFDPMASVPAWGGVGMPMQAGGGTGVGGYSGAGYNEEVAFTTDGLQLLYRFGHNFNTGSAPGFGAQNAIGVISKDGKMLAYMSDFMNTRGDSGTGSATCVSPLRAQYQPSTGGAVTYLDTVMPISNNFIYQAVGCPNNGGTTTCTETSGSLPNWATSCGTLNSYCTSDGTITGTSLDGNVIWQNKGQNSCRTDIVLMDVTSAHAAP